MDLVIMALCAVGLGAGALAFGSRILQYEAYVVRTGSMAPTIPAGSVVIVEPVSPLALKEGDILSYRRPAAPPITVTHRIVFLRLNDDDRNPAPLIRTQGDANGVPDPWQIECTAWHGAPSCGCHGWATCTTSPGNHSPNCCSSGCPADSWAGGPPSAWRVRSPPGADHRRCGARDVHRAGPSGTTGRHHRG